MSITGSLTNFSIAEILQWLENGKKTGLLTLRALSGTDAMSQQVHYIWVERGSIVAAANRLDHQGLVSLITQCRWVSDRAMTKLLEWCCPLNQPLGLSLKNHRILKPEQVEQLFQIQLLQQICPLFQVKAAQFTFDLNVPIPTREMTGLRVPATEATLMGLRVVENWENLATQLPNPNRGLLSIIAGEPQCRLDGLEWQVWKYTNGRVSLEAIAKQLKLSVEKVQEIAWRLITVGLAKEVPFFVGTLSSPAIESLPAQLFQDTKR